jgi:hypothetical protein
LRRLVFVITAALLVACQPAKKPELTPQQVLTAQSAAAQQAADRFVVLAKGYETSGAPPRQTDPTAGPLLDAVLDTDAIPIFTRTVSDVQAFERWEQAVSEVGRVYVLAGSGVTDAPTPSDAVKAQSDRNLVTFAPELGRYFDADVVLASRHCATLYYLAVTRRLDDDHRQAVMEAIEPAVEQAYRASLGMIAIAGPSDDWKEARAKVLVATAPRIASVLTIYRKQALEKDARDIAVQTSDAALKAELGAFATEIGPRL